MIFKLKTRVFATPARQQARWPVFAVLGLCVLLVTEPVMAQPEVSLPDAPQQVAGAPMALHITILEGEDALNNIRDRTAREPIVQIEDENHHPVAGVLVLFTANTGSSGASATFSGASSLSVTTGADGKAVAHGLQPNQAGGQFTINVQASLGSLTAQTLILQTNENAAPTQSSQPSSTTATIKRISTKRSWLIASGAVAVAVAVVLVGTHTSGTSITAGSGSVRQ